MGIMNFALRRRRLFVFQRIHAFNVPVAYFLAPLGDLQTKILDLRRVAIIRFRPLAFSTRDAWLRACAQAHAKAKAWLAVARPHYLVLKYKGRKIDLSRHLLQLLLQHIHDREVTSNLIQTLRQNPDCEGTRVIAVDQWLPRLTAIATSWERLVFHDGRHLVGLALGWKRGRQRPRIALERINTVIRGVASGEFADQDHQVDFTWWVRRNILDAKTTLFVLPVRPQNTAEVRLAEAGIQWIVEREVLAFMPLKDAVMAFLWALPRLFLRLFQANPSHYYQFYLLFRARIWTDFLGQLPLKHFITSLSESWPEVPEVAVAQAFNAKTVNWSYAGSSFWAADNISDYSDTRIWRSLPVAHENWTWMPAHSEVMSHRMLQSEDVRLVSIGPTMCGDPGWLKQTPAEARGRFGMTEAGFYLSVFDVPVFLPHLRQKNGIDPYMTSETQESLYRACLTALRRFPSLRILLKAKRLNRDLYEAPPSLLALTDTNGEWVRSGRVCLLDAKTDPYIAVAIADACLAAPFTSPVMLSNLVEKPSAFYDGTGGSRCSFRNVFQDISFHSELDLMDWISQTLKRYSIEPKLPDQISDGGRRLCQEMDARIRTSLFYSETEREV
jgi:hypothetical protein